MKIHLKRINDAVRFEASNERGHKIIVEGGHSVGGEDTAPAPTELLMMSHAACTAVDVIDLLKKMRQTLNHLEIELEGHRAHDQVPKLFTGIHLHYKIYGDVKSSKADKAISLSIEKYCTVSKMIDHIAKITYSFEILKGSS
ncbi:MAG: OsmC family protein [Saprospiraceae bacterium]